MAKRKKKNKTAKKAKAVKAGRARAKTAKAKPRSGAATAKPVPKRTVKLPRIGQLARPLATFAVAPPPVKHLSSGAGVPPASGSAIFDALNAVAAAHNVDPAAIAGMINTESVWDPHCVSGSYIGLTQVGPDFVHYLKMTHAQFLGLPPDAQINAYGTWLDYYRFNAQMAGLGLIVSSLPLPEQAAVLQGMQFAPNAKSWKAALAKGDLSVPTTHSKQADVLGDTSIGAMQHYYSTFFRQHPPVYG